MSKILSSLASKPIVNSGSTARDHLANERTFLAWTRTGLGFIALGVALAKLSALESLSLPPSVHRHPSSGLKPTSSGSRNLSEPGDRGEERDDAALNASAAALVASGTGCLTYGTARYFSSLSLLQKGLFRPNIAGVALVAGTAGCVAGGGVVLLVREGRSRV